MSTKRAKDHLSAAQTAQFRTKIQTAVEEGKKNSIEICQLVYESGVNMVRVDGHLRYCWETWGYDSWELFLGREMGIHLHTAYGLQKVWQTFYVDLVNDWNKALLLPITKMKLLTRVVNARNVESWLRKAKPLTCARLLALVGGAEEEMHSFAVQITNSQMNSIKKTLDQLRNSLPNGEKMTRGELLVQMARLARESAPTLRRAA